MNHLVLSASLTALATLLLGLLALAQQPRGTVTWLFVCYSWTIALWSFCFTQLHTVPAAWALWWNRLLHLGCIFIPVLFVHFCVLFSDTFQRTKPLLAVAYAVAVAYNILNLFPGIFTAEIVYRDGYAYSRPVGLLYFTYFIFFVTLIFYGLRTLWKSVTQLPPERAKGLRIFLVTTALGYLGGLNNFLLMIDARVFPIFPYGLYLVVLYSAVAAYAIHKYQLLRPLGLAPSE